MGMGGNGNVESHSRTSLLRVARWIGEASIQYRRLFVFFRCEISTFQQRKISLISDNTVQVHKG